MPTLQELAVRNAGRGVSVYSPTRPIRQPGAVANRGTAARVLQGGQGGQPAPGQFNTTPSSGGTVRMPAYRPPDQAGAGRGRTPLDDILDNMSANDPQPQQEEGGGGILGTVVNSLPFKAIMAPLQVLDIPRRAIVSTVNEVADVFNGGDVSWDDWFDQVRDPNFGFGNVIGSTGNIWADRFIGFAGDVLLDPLTYVAGAGVFSGTGRATRVRLASLAEAEGLGEDVVRSIGRYGLSGVDNSVRARLRRASNLLGDVEGEQILDRGYYFKVPFRDTFKQIPGTTKLDDLISPVFAHGRARLADSRLGTTLRNRLRVPEVMREATEKLVTGRGTMGFNDAAGIYLYNNARRHLGNTATNRFLAEATKLTNEVGTRPLTNMIDEAETVGNTALNALFARGAKFMQDAGIDFWPRKNYIPHILTQPALDWFRSGTAAAKAFREALIPGLDINTVSPRLMERHLLAGTTAELGIGAEKRAFNAGAGTIKSINEEFARVFPELKFKLFDDQIDSILAVYGRHLGDDVGEAGAVKTLLNSKSRLVRLASDDDMVKTLIDEAGLDLLNKKTADMLRLDHKSLTDRLTRLRQEQINDTLGLQGVLGVHMRETIDDLENLESSLKDELDALLVSESELSHQMGRTSAMTGEVPASNIGRLEVKLQDAYTRLEARAMAADAKLADLQQRAAAEQIAWQSMQKMFGTDVGMMTVPAEFKSLRQWNVIAAEAASLAMDREAVSTMRIELAQLIRKANLAEEAAANPVRVGLHGDIALLPEERIGAGVRLNADGSIVEYTGPTSGRLGQRGAVEEGLYQEQLVDYEVAMSKYGDDLKDYNAAMRRWRKGDEKTRGPKPAKPVKPIKPTRYKGPIGPESVRQGKGDRTFHRERERQGGRLTVATNRVRWDADQRVHDIITRANVDRERAIRDIETLSIGPQRTARAALEAELLPSDAEADLVARYGQARQALETSPEMAAYNQAQAELPQVDTELARQRDNLRKAPRRSPGDLRQQAIADANERLRRAVGTGLASDVWRREGDTIVLRDTRAARGIDLYDQYAKIPRSRRQGPKAQALVNDIVQQMGPFPRVRDPRAEALAQAERLATMRKSLQRDIKTTVEGPGKLPTLKRDPERVALEQQISTLEARQAQLKQAIADGATATKPLRDEFNQLDTQMKRQRQVYAELQKDPPANTSNLLMDTNQRILSKQAQLAEEENRVNRLADIHRDNIDNAEQRVELAVNMDADLRRRERDAWGESDEAERAAQREVRAHRDGELHAAKQAFEDAQKPVARAKTRRDQVKRELEEAKNDLAFGKDTPPEVGQMIHRANMTEKALVRDARARIPGAKTEWRIFPEIDAPPRRGVLTFEQRDRLEELYNVVHNTHPVDRAGSGGSYLVRQARETVARITDAGGPKGPRDSSALLEAQKILGDHALGRMNTGAHQRYRSALKEINAIERAVKEGPQGMTAAQQQFGEVRRIAGMVTQLEDIRTPMKMPGKRSADWKAIAESPRTVGGDRSVLGRAKENHELAEDWIDNFSQDLIDSGAIDDTHVEFIARQRDEVKRLIDVHKLRKTPDVKSDLTQVSNDLGRLVDVMLSYQASLGRGYEPGPQLATAISAHRFMRERNTLDDSIEVMEDLLKVSPEERTRVFNESITNYEAKIALEQKNMDDLNLTEKERHNAMLRRNNARRQLGKKLDAGVVMPGTGDLRGVVEDDVDSMVGIIMEHLDEFDEASIALRGATNWRDTYVNPIERRGRAEANVGRYELQTAHLDMAKTRLEKAIARARSTRSKTVTYRPTKSTSFTETISAAEKKITAGEIPPEMVPAVRNELRIAERRETPAQRLAREAGRGDAGGPPRMIKYSVTGRETAPTTMTLAEAEAELARYPQYREAIVAAQHKNAMQLETMNGESQRRITTLETLVKDSETPLNDAGIKALKARARELDALARARPGHRNMPLDKKRLPEEQAELTEIAARIEQSTSPPNPERVARMQEEIAERQKFRADYERDMVYDHELMGHVEDNGYRLLRELTQNLRAPSKAEARVLRSLIGAQQGEQAREVLATFDDFINAGGYVNKGVVTNERMEAAIRYVQDLTSTRRAGDDALDRVLPADQAGRSLSLGEMSRAAQIDTEVQMVLGGGGRQTMKQVDAEGFRENFFQLLIEQARVRRQDAERQIKHFVGWLDMAVNEDIVSTIGIVNKYFGGKLRNYTKAQRKAMRAANQPIPKLSVRRKELIRQTIVDAMERKGYDPSVSLERKLQEAKVLRARLTTTIRGLGVILAEGSDMDELMRWWDEAALGQMDTIDSLAGLTNTLRPADDIAALAKTRRIALTREINKATKAGDMETAGALSAELDILNQGRYLPEPGAVPAPPTRRPAQPSEAAANQLNDAADPEELTRLRTEQAQLEPRYLELDHQVASKSDEVRALEQSLAQAEAPRAVEGVTTESVLRELEDYAATVRKAVPKGKVSHADLELARAKSSAYAESFPMDVEMTPAQEAQLNELTNDMMRKNEKVWAEEPRAVRKKAEAIAANMPMGDQPQGAAMAPDAQAGIISRVTALRAEIKQAQDELEDVAAQRTNMQQRIDDLDKAHAARTTDDPSVETPSMIEDPHGASQAEGLPSEGLSPEAAPAHLTDDAIFDSDASPEDLLKEYDSVVAQSRALLNQYGSYRDMPPDVKRSAGELANRAESLAKRREETFTAATKGFDEADEGRLIGATQAAAQAANPRTDMDWWTAISTGTPPAGVRTQVMRQSGVVPGMERPGATTSKINRRGVLRNQLKTGLKRGMPRRGHGGSPYRGSLSARAEVLSGRHDPRAVRVPRINPKTGRKRLGPLNERAPSRFEQQARQVERYNTAERDLRGIAERTRAEAGALEEQIFATEMSMGERAANFEQASAEYIARFDEARVSEEVAQQTRLNHANDELARAERHSQRVSGQRERINDAYTRALEADNLQLGNVRRRAVEVKVDHEAATRELNLMRAATAEPKNSNMRQIWSDIGDLMKLKRSQVSTPAGPLPDMAALQAAHKAAYDAYAKASMAAHHGVKKISQAELDDLQRTLKAASDALGAGKRAHDAAAAMPPAAPAPPGPAAWWRPRVKGAPPVAPLTTFTSAQPEIRQIEALLTAAIDQQDQIDQLDLHAGVIAKRLKDFERAPKKEAFFTPEQMLAMPKADQERFEDVFQRLVADGWQPVAEDMFTGPDALVIANTLQQAMDNIRRTTREPGFWQVIEKYTAFFSTYATARPGFHVRNALSGTFMNMVDGVKIRNMRKAPGIWRDFMKDPEAFWARTGAQADQHRAAISAVFGSGAGGQFSERGLTEAVTVGGKAYRVLMNNWITKMNRKAGAYVEGPMRLAMALDSIERGMSLNAALDRITKFHFDYTQLSEMDVIARRMIPFWTFMSRNLPLQIESMWLRPRSYLQYQSLVRNFGEEMNPLTPDYWMSQGAFTVDENADKGEPWYLAPDLPHLRVAEPLTALAQGDLGRAVLSDINPLFLAPVEALAAGKKFYTGAPISDEPRAPQGAGEAMLAPLLALLGTGGEGASGQTLVDPRAAHITNSLLPPIEWLNRLTSNEGAREGRQGETIARSFGAPVYKLTEGVQNQTRMSNYYDDLDERERQAALARL